jgi:DNA-binding beta-propeller fold protein YncE
VLIEELKAPGEIGSAEIAAHPLARRANPRRAMIFCMRPGIYAGMGRKPVGLIPYGTRTALSASLHSRNRADKAVRAPGNHAGPETFPRPDPSRPEPMNTSFRRDLLNVLCFAVLALCPLHAAEPLVAETPILVPNSKGGFDFLHIDAARRRLLAAHTGNGTLDVFDLDTGKILRQVPTGKAQGEAVDEAGGKYYVSVSAEKIVAVVDAETLEKKSEIKLPGEADDILFNPKNRCLYVDHDHGTNVWVIDVKTEKITGAISIPETPECLVYDPSSDRVFQNVISDNSLHVIDPAGATVKEHWPLAPAAKPHGLAIDVKTHRLFSAGNNGKLVVIDSTNGKIIATVDIAPGTDQVAFDAGNQRVYCGCGNGVISVVQETESGATLLGNVKTVGTGKTLAVDPKTHAVWTAYFDKTNCYALKLTAQ